MKRKLKVVITGAASGIGKALSSVYLSKDAQVAALDVSEKGLHTLKEELTSKRLFTIVTDVSSQKSVDAAGDQIKETFGQPDIWINNAGISPKLGPFEKMNSEDFERVVKVNFEGVVHGTRTALRLMKEPVHGTIANVSSINAEVPAPYMTPYVSAKHAVAGFTRALQLEMELSQNPIRVILVLPGFAKTPIMNAQEGFEFLKFLQKIAESPESVAHSIMTGIESGQKEIVPTWNGKILRRLYQIAPKTTAARMPRLLLAKTWKEILGLNPIDK